MRVLDRGDARVLLDLHDATLSAARRGCRGRRGQLPATLDGLEGLAEKFRGIGDVRGMGLMQAIELVKDRGTKEPDAQGASRLMEATRKRGLLVGKGGLYGNTMRIAPPASLWVSVTASRLARGEKPPAIATALSTVMLGT